MGRYMTVLLKPQYKNDNFIRKLNRELTGKFGAGDWPKFNPWYFLDGEADFINYTEEGKNQLEGWERPITKEALSVNFFWMRNGEFHLKISGGPTLEEAKEALAVCKWITVTRGKYIDKSKSDNYSKEILKEYLGHLFDESGHESSLAWDF